MAASACVTWRSRTVTYLASDDDSKEESNYLIVTNDRALLLNSATLQGEVLSGYEVAGWKVAADTRDISELDDLSPQEIADVLGWVPATGRGVVTLNTSAIVSVRRRENQTGKLAAGIGIPIGVALTIGYLALVAALGASGLPMRIGGRRVLARLAETGDGKQLLECRPELSTIHVDHDFLRTLPAESFGAAYVRHFDSHGITADQPARIPEADDSDLTYLVRRFRQSHDVWHTLLGVGITKQEEVILHAFTFGQLHLPVSAMIVLCGTMRHLVLERRWGALRHSLLDAYTAGRDAAQLLGVRWEDLWEQPLDRVRAMYAIRKLDRRYLH